jgi:hypothetical protein
MSFFVHLDDDNYPDSPSTIKFGGWDLSSTYTGPEVMGLVPLKFIKTADTKSWDINVNRFQLHKTDRSTDIKLESGRMRLDPGLPYLYLPKTVY